MGQDFKTPVIWARFKWFGFLEVGCVCVMWKEATWENESPFRGSINISSHEEMLKHIADGIDINEVNELMIIMSVIECVCVSRPDAVGEVFPAAGFQWTRGGREALLQDSGHGFVASVQWLFQRAVQQQRTTGIKVWREFTFTDVITVKHLNLMMLASLTAHLKFERAEFITGALESCEVQALCWDVCDANQKSQSNGFPQVFFYWLMRASCDLLFLFGSFWNSINSSESSFHSQEAEHARTEQERTHTPADKQDWDAAASFTLIDNLTQKPEVMSPSQSLLWISARLWLVRHDWDVVVVHTDALYLKCVSICTFNKRKQTEFMFRETQERK